MPESRKQLEQPGASIYEAFSYLLTSVVQLHKQNDTRRLKMAYQFAAWSFRQKEKHLWNAAGVAFYEHLGDYEETRNAISHWTSYDIYKDVRVLIQLFITEEQLKEIDKGYKR